MKIHTLKKAIFFHLKNIYFLPDVFLSGKCDCMKPLDDDIINNIFIPAVTGFAVDDSERYLLSLPISSVGLGIQVPSDMCEEQYQMSRKITDMSP